MHKRFVGVIACLGLFAPLHAGNLTPPGAPAPSMVTLDELNTAIAGATAAATDAQDDRIPIDTLAGDANSHHRITQRGSYYLRGNITCSAGFSGIEIGASFVTVDLNGFTITGASGNHGIRISTFSNPRSITIRNGTIFQAGLDGIGGDPTGTVSELSVEDVALLFNGDAGIELTAFTSNYKRLRASNNATIGIDGTTGTVISECTATLNGTTGIRAQGGNLIDCVATQNGVGISVISGSTISRCTANFNATGILAGTSIITDCTANSNTDIGFNLASDTIITNCIAGNNATYGIRATQGATIRDCTVRGNGFGVGGAGIFLSSNESRVEGNLLFFNEIGLRANSSGNFIAGNRASANVTSDYSIVAGNVDAAVVTPGSGFTAIDPMANISY